MLVSRFRKWLNTCNILFPVVQKVTQKFREKIRKKIKSSKLIQEEDLERLSASHLKREAYGRREMSSNPTKITTCAIQVKSPRSVPISDFHDSTQKYILLTVHLETPRNKFTIFTYRKIESIQLKFPKFYRPNDKYTGPFKLSLHCQSGFVRLKWKRSSILNLNICLKVSAGVRTPNVHLLELEYNLALS